VAFKHAEVSVAEDGRATLTDLGTGQTWLGDELLGANESRALSSGDVVRCGEARLSVTLRQAAPPAPAPSAVPTGPQAPWQPPSAAEVAAARHTPPRQILAALPASQLDLVARAARAIPLPRWRADQPRSERAFVDHDAEAFAHLARGVLDGRYLPEDMGTWLRWEEQESSFLCRSALEDGATVILAPWDLLARLPEPLPGSGPARVGRFLELLLPRNTGRLVAEEEGELAGGFWRCRYASRAGLCAGRFSSIEARSNGHVLTATLTPRFPLQGGPPTFAEDPLDLAMNDLRERPAWRPPPRGHGAPAPHVPRGGRRRDRHLPRRSQARDHYR
jgi:FHA domain-containing protein